MCADGTRGSFSATCGQDASSVVVWGEQVIDILRLSLSNITDSTQIHTGPRAVVDRRRWPPYRITDSFATCATDHCWLVTLVFELSTRSQLLKQQSPV